MQFFSVEWLGDGQISVERDDGATFQGCPEQILPSLLRGSAEAGRVPTIPPRQDAAGGAARTVL